MKPACLILLLFLSTPLLKAEEIEMEKTVSGTISALDWVSSTITVRYFPAFSADADEINLKVTEESSMLRGTDSISFSDIDQTDPVTVTYYNDGLSGLKILRLTDLNDANT